ncbi:MAG: hypothetical protein WCN21_14925 [Comamonadaceae bacterium]
MIWSDFYSWVLSSVPGCPNPTLDLHIRQAAIDFCRRTLCWVRTLDPVEANGMDIRFDLDLPSQTQAVKLMAVAVNGLQYLLVDTQRGLQLVRQGSGADFSFTQDKLTLDVHPLRQRGDSIEVDMALAPSFNASGIETDVASPHTQEIAQGALATLQMMVGVAWSDPGLAGANRVLFNQRVATVAMHFARGQGAAKLVSSRTYC